MAVIKEKTADIPIQAKSNDTGTHEKLQPINKIRKGKDETANTKRNILPKSQNPFNSLTILTVYLQRHIILDWHLALHLNHYVDEEKIFDNLAKSVCHNRNRKGCASR